MSIKGGSWQERQISGDKKEWMKQNLDNIFAGKTYKDIYGFSNFDDKNKFTDENKQQTQISLNKMDKGLAGGNYTSSRGYFKSGEKREDGPWVPTENTGGLTDWPGSGEATRAIGTAYDILHDKKNYNIVGYGKDGNADVRDIILNMAEERYYNDMFTKYTEELEAMNESFSGPYMDGNQDSRAYRELKWRAFDNAYNAVEYPFEWGENDEVVIKQDSPYSIDNIRNARLEADPGYVPAMAEPGDPGYEKKIINNMVDDEESFLE